MTLNSNLTAQAIFGTTLTTLTNPASTGSILRAPALALYPYGSPVRLTTLPSASPVRYLAFWTGALSGAISPRELIVTNPNPTVGATFGNLSAGQFALTMQITGEGTAGYTPATNRFASNSVVTLTATPKPGWFFVNWSGGSNSTANPLALVMHTNKTVTANFSPSAGGNVPPSISLTNPAPGAIFTAPASVALVASVTDSDGTVTNVSFYFAGTNFIGRTTNAPFNFTWTGVGGGFSGCLVSKPGEEWLQIATSASLAGYPVEGIPAQDCGKMHRTAEQPVPWSGVLNQVYATTQIKSYPGNSGGPILVQLSTNVNSWPAAVYLGGSGNTLVRAIDSLAVGLINTAEVLGNAGGNNTGGEPPRRATDCPTCSPLIYGVLEVSLQPTNIGTLGGGYRFRNATNGVIFREPFNRFFVLGNVPWTLEFLPAPYTIAPTNRTVTTTAGTTNKTTGLYKQWGQLTFHDGHLRVLGSSGALYRIDFKPC